MTQRDIRETELFNEADSLYRSLRDPKPERIGDATELHVSPDGCWAVFAGTLQETFEGLNPTRICEVELSSGNCRVISPGPNTDRSPKYSSDGIYVAYLSDKYRAGDFQLQLFNRETGSFLGPPDVEGWIEYLQWSPNGKSILLGVAGHGADISGGQGAVTSKQANEDLPSWMPMVSGAREQYRWRRLWVYELERSSLRPITGGDLNVWEAAWAGNDAVAAVMSAGPEEGLWYTARLVIMDVQSGISREVFRPKYQIGWPAGSPAGTHVAIVEAISSDRWLVAGDLMLLDVASGKLASLDTHGVDITYTEWRSDRFLLLAGHRGFETVVGIYDVASRSFRETWVSREVTTGGFYVKISGIDDSGGFALVGENFTRAPEIATVRKGIYKPIKSFDVAYASATESIDAVKPVTWNAADGSIIQGWLILPRTARPHPLIMYLHGGPVWHNRPFWLGRASIHLLMLVKRGYAIFFPNPRGSSGRGQEFARQVEGDMGGSDATDCLSGLDYLISDGLADASRIGVTGRSYGGYLSSWLITRDQRFAAAVPIAPVTNWVSEHLISNLPQFVPIFLADTYTNVGGKYYERSPIMYADRVKTPTLHICGLLDRCTPPEEAIQFHNALLENGVESLLVIYPEEGHGIRQFPAAIDFAARVVGWFERHMSKKV